MSYFTRMMQRIEEEQNRKAQEKANEPPLPPSQMSSRSFRANDPEGYQSFVQEYDDEDETMKRLRERLEAVRSGMNQFSTRLDESNLGPRGGIATGRNRAEYDAWERGGTTFEDYGPPAPPQSTAQVQGLLAQQVEQDPSMVNTEDDFDQRMAALDVQSAPEEDFGPPAPALPLASARWAKYGMDVGGSMPQLGSLEPRPEVSTGPDPRLAYAQRMAQDQDLVYPTTHEELGDRHTEAALIEAAQKNIDNDPGYRRFVNSVGAIIATDAPGIGAAIRRRFIDDADKDMFESYREYKRGVAGGTGTVLGILVPAMAEILLLKAAAGVGAGALAAAGMGSTRAATSLRWIATPNGWRQIRHAVAAEELPFITGDLLDRRSGGEMLLNMGLGMALGGAFEGAFHVWRARTAQVGLRQSAEEFFDLRGRPSLPYKEQEQLATAFGRRLQDGDVSFEEWAATREAYDAIMGPGGWERWFSPGEMKLVGQLEPRIKDADSLWEMISGKLQRVKDAPEPPGATVAESVEVPGTPTAPRRGSWAGNDLPQTRTQEPPVEAGPPTAVEPTPTPTPEPQAPPARTVEAQAAPEPARAEAPVPETARVEPAPTAAPAAQEVPTIELRLGPNQQEILGLPEVNMLTPDGIIRLRDDVGSRLAAAEADIDGPGGKKAWNVLTNLDKHIRDRMVRAGMDPNARPSAAAPAQPEVKVRAQKPKPEQPPAEQAPAETVVQPRTEPQPGVRGVDEVTPEPSEMARRPLDPDPEEELKLIKSVRQRLKKMIEKGKGYKGMEQDYEAVSVPPKTLRTEEGADALYAAREAFYRYWNNAPERQRRPNLRQRPEADTQGRAGVGQPHSEPLDPTSAAELPPAEEGFAYTTVSADVFSAMEAGRPAPLREVGSGYWPDGASEPRSYWYRTTGRVGEETQGPEHAVNRALTKGEDAEALLRVSDAEVRLEDQTGDYYTRRAISPHKIEYLGEDGQWRRVRYDVPQRELPEVTRQMAPRARGEAPVSRGGETAATDGAEVATPTLSAEPDSPFKGGGRTGTGPTVPLRVNASERELMDLADGDLFYLTDESLEELLDAAVARQSTVGARGHGLLEGFIRKIERAREALEAGGGKSVADENVSVRGARAAEAEADRLLREADPEAYAEMEGMPRSGPEIVELPPEAPRTDLASKEEVQEFLRHAYEEPQPEANLPIIDVELTKSQQKFLGGFDYFDEIDIRMAREQIAEAVAKTTKRKAPTEAKVASKEKRLAWLGEMDKKMEDAARKLERSGGRWRSPDLAKAPERSVNPKGPAREMKIPETAIPDKPKTREEQIAELKAKAEANAKELEAKQKELAEIRSGKPEDPRPASGEELPPLEAGGEAKDWAEWEAFMRSPSKEGAKKGKTKKGKGKDIKDGGLDSGGPTPATPRTGPLVETGPILKTRDKLKNAWESVWKNTKAEKGAAYPTYLSPKQARDMAGVLEKHGAKGMSEAEAAGYAADLRKAADNVDASSKGKLEEIIAGRDAVEAAPPSPSTAKIKVKVGANNQEVALGVVKDKPMGTKEINDALETLDGMRAGADEKKLAIIDDLESKLEKAAVRIEKKAAREGGFIDLSGVGKGLGRGGKGFGQGAARVVAKNLSSAGDVPQEVFDASVRKRGNMRAEVWNIQTKVGDLKRALEADYGKLTTNANELPATVMDQMDDLLRGRATARSTGLSPQVADAVYAMRGHVDRLTNIIKREGLVSGDLAATFMENQGIYLNRSYSLFEDPDNYFPDEVIRNKYIDWARSTLKRTDGSAATDDEVAEGMRALLSRKPGGVSPRAVMAGLAEVQGGIIKPRSGFVPESVMRRLDDTLVGVPRAEVEKMVDEFIMGDSDRLISMLGDMAKADGSDSKAINELMREVNGRKEIPEPIRALWGEEKNPIINYVRTVEKQMEFLESRRFARDAVETGQKDGWIKQGKDLGFPEVRATEEGWTKLDKSKWFDFTGDPKYRSMWARTDEFEAMEYTFASQEVNNGYWRFAIGANAAIKKGLTVHSYGTHGRNIMGGSYFAAINGHISLFNPKVTFDNIPRAARAAEIARQSMDNMFGKVGDDQAVRDFIEDLTRENLIGTNVQVNEIASMLRDANRSGWDPSSVKRIVDGTTSKAKAWDKVHTEVYQAEDSFWKILMYMSEHAQHKSAFEAAAAKGFDVPDAVELHKMVAQKVRDTYPNYDMVSPLMRKLRRSPLIGAFPSFPFEFYRTTKNTGMMALREMTSKEYGGALRMRGLQRFLGLTSTYAGPTVMAGLTRHWSGMTEEDQKAFGRLRASYQRYSDFIFLGRDSEGNIKFWDISYADPSSYLRKTLNALDFNFDEPTLERAFNAGAHGLFEFLTPFVGADVVSGFAMSMAKGTFFNDDQIIDSFIEASVLAVDRMAPGNIRHMRQLYGATVGHEALAGLLPGEYRRSGRPYDLGEELMALIGIRASSANPTQDFGNAMRGFSQELSTSDRALANIVMNTNDVSDEELEGAFLRHQSEQERYLRQAHMAVQAGLQLDVDDGYVFDTSKSNPITGRLTNQINSDRMTGVTSQQLQAAGSGIFETTEFGDRWLQQRIARGEAEAWTPERGQQLSEAQKKRLEKLREFAQKHHRRVYLYGDRE